MGRAGALKFCSLGQYDPNRFTPVTTEISEIPDADGWEKSVICCGLDYKNEEGNLCSLAHSLLTIFVPGMTRSKQSKLFKMAVGIAYGGLSTPEYEAMVTRIHDATLGAGGKLGGPVQWQTRDDFSFFQAPAATTLVGRGAKDLLNSLETVASVEGTE